ncbi:MAG: heat shock protein HspQ [Alphaproteobacteria bacterium]|nr:heat shock protein HspQ [Alphaproteobacteria bacterium]MBF0250011.1 heat shock protein HspQ [Alphaproteobacteria bacterium]
MSGKSAKYTVGQLVHNTLLGYRGVVVDVDAHFRVGRAMNAPETRGGVSSCPWYHVLVDGSADLSYVSERNLEPDAEGGPIRHPDVDKYFERLNAGGYVPRRGQVN